MLRGKKYKQSVSSYNPMEEYGLDKAIDLLHSFSKSNFSFRIISIPLLDQYLQIKPF